MCRRGTESLAVRNPSAVSASCAEDITASIILHTTWIAALGDGGTESLRMESEYGLAER